MLSILRRAAQSLQLQIALAAILGGVSGYLANPSLQFLATSIMELFTNALRLISLPIIFLSLLCSLTGMKEISHLRKISSHVLKWTLITTVLASFVALALFLLVSPAHLGERMGQGSTSSMNLSFWDHLMGIIPSNPFQPFIDGNVVGILLLAISLGIALSQVPGHDKVHDVLSPLLAAMMKIVQVIVRFIPLTVWAGIVLSFEELVDGRILGQMALYLLVVISANLVQGFIVLPLILKYNGRAPWEAMRRFMPALSVAFFSKSSVATLPIAIKTAEDQLHVHKSIARFVFPICTTINMNGCAAFILTTTLFVAISQGVEFSTMQLLAWVFVSTVAAVGNAGVPMGCYFLSSAILAAIGVPLDMMALILPFYGIIDMVETALNVWSDGCVAMLVDKSCASALPPSTQQ